MTFNKLNPLLLCKRIKTIPSIKLVNMRQLSSIKLYRSRIHPSVYSSQGIGTNANTKSVFLAKSVSYQYCCRRPYSSSEILTDEAIKKHIETISDNFTEAIALIEDARDSLGTVYFSADMCDAEEAVKDILASYDALLIQLTEKQKENVVRTIGLKIHELKAQLSMVKDMLKD